MIPYRTVLVLEDEPILAFGLEDMLLSLGFEEVRLAATIDEACGHLVEGLPQVAVLDVNIRGERSYDLADSLIERSVPFVFATGYGDAEHPEALRAIPTLTKPYSVEDLRAALAAAAVAS